MTKLKWIVLVGFSWLLMACTQPYSMSPRTNVYIAHGAPRQIMIQGPFQVKLITGAPSSKVIFYGPMKTVHTEITMSNHQGQLKIVTSRLSRDNDIRRVGVIIYLSNPKSIMVDGASSLNMISKKQQSYNLTVQNTVSTRLKGSFILPTLMLKDNGNFSAKGVVFLGNLIQRGTGNISINQLQGGLVNISDEGVGTVRLTAKQLGLSHVIYDSLGGLYVNNVGATAIARRLVVYANGAGDVYLQGLTVSSLDVAIGPNIDFKYSGNVTQTDSASLRFSYEDEDFFVLKAYGLGNTQILYHAPRKIKGNIKEYAYLNAQTQEFGSFILTRFSHSNVSFVGKNKVIRMDAVLRHHTRLEGRQLYLTDAYIKTHDEAIAKVSVSNRIFGNSFDESLIEYYGYPPYHFGQAREASADLPLSLYRGGYAVK